MGSPIQWTPLIVPNGGINENESPQLIKENEWTAAENAEPLPDGVRSRRGSTSTQSSKGYRQYAFVLPNQVGGDESDYEMVEDTSTWIAQGFEVSEERDVDSITIQLTINSGTPVGLVEAALFNGGAVATDIPDAAITGANFSDWSSLEASEIDATTRTYYRFTLDTPTTLDAGTEYFVVIRHSRGGATGTNTLDITYDTNDAYDKGLMFRSGDGGTWTVTGANDRLSFAVSGSTTVIGLGSIDVSSEDGTDSDVFTQGDDEFMSQGFQLTSDAWVNKISVRLKHDGTPAPVDKIYCWITGDDGGEPSWNGGTSEDLDENLTYDPARIERSEVGTSFAWHDFVFPNAIFCSASTQYHFVIFDSDVAADDSMSIEMDDGGNPYAGGTSHRSTNGTSWTEEASRDLNFRIYSGSKIIQAISDYRLSDAATSYHLVVAGGEVFKYASSAYTSLSGGVSLTAGADIFPSWAVGNDRWFVTDNTVVSKKFYSLSSTEYWENEGIAPPTDALTLTSPAQANALPDGTYYVDYIYWNNDLGIPSNAWNDFVPNATNEVAVAVGDVINVAGLPTAVDRSGDRATGVRVYLREVGSAIFRLVLDKTFAQVTSASGAFDIDTTNLPTTIEAEPDHDVPPLHKIKCIAENRQFILDVDDGTSRPSRLMFSAIFGGVPYYESYPPNNYRDFGLGDGDHGTALAYVPPRTLLVGFRNSIFALDARNPKTSDKVVVSRHIGIAGHNSVVVQGQRVFFLSDSSRNLGMYMWQPGTGEPQLLPGIDDTLKSMNTGRLKYASCAVFAPGDNRFQWWTLLSSASATQHDRILVYDWNLQAWTIYTKDAVRALNVLGMIETSGIDQIYGGGYDGAEYLQDQGSTDAGKEFYSSFTMKQFDFGASHIIKKFRWVDFAADASSTKGIAVTVERDYGSRSYLLGTTLTVSQPDGMVWGTGTWGEDRWQARVDAKGRTALRGVAEVFKPTLGSSGQFHLKTLQFGVQPTGRK